MSDFEIAFTDEAVNLPAVKEVADKGLQPHNVDEMLMEIRNQPNLMRRAINSAKLRDKSHHI